MHGETRASSGRTAFVTPRAFADRLISEFALELDVAATAENARLPEFFTREDDALKRKWSPRRCWMNPPYGKGIGEWVRKARAESLRGALVVGLVPASTDTTWWHENIEGVADVRFVRGRIRFEGEKHGAPFPSAVIIWRPRCAA